MRVLVLGGRGKTALPLAELLDGANVPFSLASRSKSEPCRYDQVHFDWKDEKTYSALFEDPKHGLTSVYLVGPPVDDMLPPAKAFIDIAISSGVKRIVLLSASSIERGGPAMGQIHQYLSSLDGVEYAVLRPTWFMENLTQESYRMPIRSQGKMLSATGDGKIPWISTQDIAAVAKVCLTADQLSGTEHIILGPELLSYDDVAAVLSEVTGRHVQHVKLSVPELIREFVNDGLTEDYAKMLAEMDGSIAQGSEARLNDEVVKTTGREPRSLKDFATVNRAKWI